MNGVYVNLGKVIAILARPIKCNMNVAFVKELHLHLYILKAHNESYETRISMKRVSILLVEKLILLVCGYMLNKLCERCAHYIFFSENFIFFNRNYF